MVRSLCPPYGESALNDYQVPFKFSGKLVKRTLDLNRPILTL